MIFKLHLQRCWVVLLWMVLLPQLLAGCAESKSTEGSAVSAKSSIGLGQPPDILSRAVDPAQLRPVVTMNGVLVSPERASDGGWFVNYLLFGTSLAIEMSWVENYNDQDLTLASWSGNFANISSSSSFTIPVEEYDSDSHDNDSDGMSNLAERIANSDPNARPFSATDIRGVWIGPCEVSDDSFDFVQYSVTFGPTSYQYSYVRYLSPTGCVGTNSASVNFLGNYLVTGETTELDDGVANHLDIIFRNGTVSAGDEYIDLLASIGTTLQDVYTAEGIENINDVSLEQFGVPERYFTIYRINGDQIIFGADTVLRNGTSVERRHNVFEIDEIFTKN